MRSGAFGPVLEHLIGKPLGLHRFEEALLAFVHPRVVAATEAEEPELANSSLDQMLDGQLDRCAVVHADMGKAQVGDHTAKLHDRRARAAHSVGHPDVLDAGQDAVSLPALEPLRRRLVEAVGCEADRPRPVVPAVLGHPAHQAASECPRGLDHQRHTTSLLHNLSPREDLAAERTTIDAGAAF